MLIINIHLCKLKPPREVVAVYCKLNWLVPSCPRRGQALTALCDKRMTLCWSGGGTNAHTPLRSDTSSSIISLSKLLCECIHSPGVSCSRPRHFIHTYKFIYEQMHKYSARAERDRKQLWYTTTVARRARKILFWRWQLLFCLCVCGWLDGCFI